MKARLKNVFMKDDILCYYYTHGAVCEMADMAQKPAREHGKIWAAARAINKTTHTLNESDEYSAHMR